jgi:outer membrane immunogenic protein
VPRPNTSPSPIAHHGLDRSLRPIDGIGNQGGFISGALRYDYQTSPRIVIGAFADADFSNLRHSTSLKISQDDATLGVGIRSEFKDIFMVGGRVGYLTTPDTLIFASAGYANAGLSDTQIGASIDVGGINDSAGTVLFGGKRFSGVFVGGGAETRINDELSLKAEYRYVDLGSESMTFASQRCAGN